MKRNWTEIEINQLKRDYPVIYTKKLAKEMNRSVSSIYSKANLLKIEKINIENKNNKKTDISFLLNDSLISLYWIGYLFADGTIINKKHLKLTSVNKDNIKGLAKIINSKIYEHKTDNAYKNNHISFSVSAYDIKLIPLLMDKYDIKTNKTYNPPNIEQLKLTDHQLLSLIVGFVQGDGCVSLSNRKNKRISIECHKSWLSNLTYMNKFLHNYFNVEIHNKTYITKRGYAYLNIGKKEILNGIKKFNQEILKVNSNKINKL